MTNEEIDELVEQKNLLALRVNEVLYRQDIDVVLGVFATLISLYLKSLPKDEREAELQDWLRLVRMMAGIAGLQ